MSKLNPICSKCISAGGVTCCSCKPWIPLTIDDIRRIGKILNQDFQKFCVVEERRKEDTVSFDEWRRVNLPLINGRFYMICMKKDGNNCVFLKKGVTNGCALGSNRAFICKLYPLWFDSAKRLIYEADEFCFFIKDKVPIKNALCILGETEESIRSYFLNIRYDWIKNKTIHRKMMTALLRESEK